MQLTRLSEIIDFQNIDIGGIWSLLKEDCIKCNLNERRDNDTKCEDCNLVFNSTYYSTSEEKRRSRVGCGYKFKQYGIKQPAHLGKCQLFYLLHNPELNFKLPDFPSEDLFGKPFNDTWCWHIHHLNRKYWDDSKRNLLLLLNGEHPLFEIRQ